MNRQAKRLLERQQARQAKADRVPATRRPPMPEQRKRLKPRQFLREVRQELRKVNWPTRRELLTYTIVVLFTVVLLTSIVFGLDFIIARAVLQVFGG
ncbi:MAG: preprotein translocase subunit SecE [Actinomycetota bacterium]